MADIDDSPTVAGRARAEVGRGLVAAAATVVVIGVVLGVLWWVAAPLARAEVVDGSVFLTGHEELRAAQDGWFAVITGLAGVLAGAVLSLRSGGPRAAANAGLGPVLGVLVALVAWRTGVLLGPPSIVEQVRDGASHPLTPLQLHAYGVLLVGPFLLALTRLLASLFSADPAAAARRPARS